MFFVDGMTGRQKAKDTMTTTNAISLDTLNTSATDRAVCAARHMVGAASLVSAPYSVSAGWDNVTLRQSVAPGDSRTVARWPGRWIDDAPESIRAALWEMWRLTPTHGVVGGANLADARIRDGERVKELRAQVRAALGA
jgi:hypothetical protein